MADERTNGEGIIGRRDETGQPRAVIVPEATECLTKSRERCWSILALLSCSMTLETQERLDAFVVERIKQGEHKRINEHDHAKQLETRLQGPQARTFQRSFAFARAKTGFNLPTPSIGEKDLPCLHFCLDCLIGNKRHHAFFHPRFHQKQLVPGFRMEKRSPPEIAWHLLSCIRIPNFFLCSILLSLSNLPELLSLSRQRQKLVPFDPAYHKTSAVLQEQHEPIS